MTTQVPALTIGPTGPVLPDASDILAGRQADFQAAFGGNLAPALNTPQGQLASSEAAIVNDTYGAYAALAAGIDPATSSGRLQDGIARFYFLTRNPAQPTTVVLTCTGKTNTPIPVNAKAVDQAGNVYLCTQAGTIPAGGSIDLEFACQVTGPTPAPAGYVDDIYQAIPGWDSCTNAADGVLGNDVESPADFEYRRASSVALNSIAQTGAILGAVLSTVTGVLDAYALENPLGITSGCDFTGSITGNILTVTAVDSGVPAQGDMLLGATSGSVITGLIDVSFGIGTYSLSITEPSPIAGLFSCAPGGVRLEKNSIYVAAFGGAAQDIGNAIFRKKNPGCNYNGNTSVTVQDTNAAYSPPYPTYTAKFQVPTPTPVKVAVMLQNNGGVPTTAVADVQAAVLARFNGTDGTAAQNYADASPKERIAGAVFGSSYYRGIAALGAWALIYRVQVGIDAANQDSVRMRADQIPTLSVDDIAVTFS